MAGTPRIDLDHNATSALRPSVREVVLRALEEGGNPSSVHAEGRRARARIEEARESVAAVVGASPRSVIFTSGGTEANILALGSALEVAGRRPTRLLVSAIEHPCVLEGARFPADRVERFGVTPDGVADLDALRTKVQALAGAGEVPLVALQVANNETGVVQPVREAAAIVHGVGGVLHCDAVQGLGKLTLDIRDLGADTLALSAHKIGGPQGVGALILHDASVSAERLMRGGGQERGWRAGTENGPGIAGFGAAALAVRAPLGDEASRLASLRDELEAGLRRIAPEVEFFGANGPRLPNTTLLALPGLSAETALIAFDLKGFALSSGAACSSGKVRTSHVLAAMGVDPDLARGALRISLGWNNSKRDVICFLDAFAQVRDSHLSRRNPKAA